VRRIAPALVFAIALASAPSAARAAESAMLEALVVDERIDEISGLAASRRHPGVLWVHNDSDRPAELYALATDGTLRATLRVRGKRNIDWEDLAAFEWDGKPYLLIADVGDNGGLRRELQLHAIEEPAALADGEAPVAWTVRFRWPDGPRDCEAVAVDVREGMVYLISKKRVPPELFRVALRPARREVQVAERIGSLAGVLQPTPADLQRNPVYGRYRSQITAADISPDGSLFAVLNYRTAYVWGRHPAGWGTALRAPPRTLGFPWVPQAEALGFDRDGRSLWVGSERLPAPLLRLPLEAPRGD
jgi:hypothetical protein